MHASIQYKSVQLQLITNIATFLSPKSYHGKFAAKFSSSKGSRQILPTASYNTISVYCIASYSCSAKVSCNTIASLQCLVKACNYNIDQLQPCIAMHMQLYVYIAIQLQIIGSYIDKLHIITLVKHNYTYIAVESCPVYTVSFFHMCLLDMVSWRGEGFWKYFCTQLCLLKFSSVNHESSVQPTAIAIDYSQIIGKQSSVTIQLHYSYIATKFEEGISFAHPMHAENELAIVF